MSTGWSRSGASGAAMGWPFEDSPQSLSSGRCTGLSCRGGASGKTPQHRDAKAGLGGVAIASEIRVPEASPTLPAAGGALPQRVWILANPRAGRGHGQSVAESINQALRAFGRPATISYEPPERAGPAERPDVIVVVGGDGTLRGAVQRMLELYGADVPPMLPVPMGTANLIGQYLGMDRGLLSIGVEGVRALAHSFSAHEAVRRLPRLRLGSMRLRPRLAARRMLRRLLPPAAQVVREAADRALRALERLEIHRIDAGIANGRLFLLMAGIGFDAHIIHALDERRGGPIGLLSYALPAASAVARYGFPPLRVDVDGGRVFGPRQGVVMIANLPQYGTGFPIVPGARGDDGLLDVLCLPCASRARLIELFALATEQRHMDVPGAVRATGRSIHVTSEVAIPVQIDGDPGGTLPLTATLHAQQVPLVRPAR